MGAARLLAKAWVAFCVFAGAYEAQRLLTAGIAPQNAVIPVAVCVVLFSAMGLLFVAGYGVSGTSGSFFARVRSTHWLPGFNGLIFILFAAAIFLTQTLYLPENVSGGVLGALQAAVHFAIPGQRVLEEHLDSCSLDGGRIVASALSWLLAFIFLGSGLSRVRLTAGIARLERRARPDALSASAFTMLLGILAVIGIQFLFLGSAYDLLSCDTLIDLPGQLLIGAGPMMLAYLIVAAVTDLLALGPED